MARRKHVHKEKTPVNKYFFIPGRLVDLSYQELRTVLDTFVSHEAAINSKSNNYFLVETKAEVDEMRDVFKRLGGYIKFGEVIDLEGDFLDRYIEKGKVTFGVSFFPFTGEGYGNAQVKEFSGKIKDYYKSKGVKSRYVGTQGEMVSAGQIVQRDVLDRGFDINIFETNDNKLVAGNTLEVQDIDGFTERDYGKPGVDKKMGMLPPKLARIMVNLAGIKPEASKPIWDPFCGSGTILTEAMLLGYSVIGSDISEQAVSDTEKNILWIGEKYDVPDLMYNVFEYDVTKSDYRLRRDLRNSEVGAIVFEPYMGPPQRMVLSEKKAEKLLKDVSELYKSIFEFLENIKQHNLKVVAVLPSYKTNKGWVTIRYETFLSNRWNIKNKKMKNKDLHWSRSNSIIRRNILIAELKR